MCKFMNLLLQRKKNDTKNPISIYSQLIYSVMGEDMCETNY